MKLICSYVFIILIPIIFFSGYLFNEMYENTITETTRKNEYMLEIEKTNIVNSIEIIERTAQVVVSDKGAVKEYLESDEDVGASFLIEFKNKTFNFLESLLYSNPNIENIRIYTNNPYVTEIYPIIFNESRTLSKPWVKEVNNKNGLVLWDINNNEKDVIKRYDRSFSNMETYVMLLREIKNRDGSHNGILEIDIPLSHFFSKAFSSVQDRDSQMLVIDRKGLIYTNEKADIFNHIGVAEIQQEFNKHNGSKESSYSFTHNGEPYIYIQTYIEQMDLHVLNIVSLAKPISDINRTRNSIIVTTIVLITLLSVITYFLHSMIFKKLRILRDSMKKVRKGNFSIDFDIKGTDEVGELANHFRLMLRRINELIVDAVNKQATFKEAELKSLKNQIDSHFLYNTLENLKMMAEIEQQFEISDALTSLGGMMRYSLQWTSSHVRLQDEISHIQNYIAIMNVRYDGSLGLTLNIPPDFLQQELPKMSLQPLVENAVKYGMMTMRNRNLLITINVFVQGDNLIIEMIDNGSGIPEDKLRAVNAMIHMDDADYQRMRNQLPLAERGEGGIGLRNVNQRIRMQYGKEFGIQMESQEGSFTQVHLTMPYIILTTGGEHIDA
ncbi:MAG: histidine kinase [Gorillibacterium sp.]|nr:histidine kinase [Gorillibacterium sp.]